MDARGKFGEHEKCVRVARDAAVSNSSFLSALQTSHILKNEIKFPEVKEPRPVHYLQYP